MGALKDGWFAAVDVGEVADAPAGATATLSQGLVEEVLVVPRAGGDCRSVRPPGGFVKGSFATIRLLYPGRVGGC